MTVRRRADSDRDDRRRTLIRAADTLLLELPYHEVRVEDVARAAGVAKGPVFLYFRNKESLALAVLRARLDGLAEEVIARAATVTSPEALVTVMIEAHRSSPSTARMIGLYSALLQFAAPSDEVAGFLLRVSELVALIAESLAPSLGRPVDEVRRMIDATGMAILSHAVTGRDARLQASADKISQSVAALG